ncbi:MAG: lamin tail domain-containing protein [Saprospiraceae bacterium]|nr:lamin tail domain-containing protein [Lewinella sp.]
MYKYALSVILLLCGLSLSAQSRHQVTANPDNTFNPITLSISVGDTVMWTNNGGNHNVNGSTDVYSENPAGFSSGDLSTDLWTYEFVFTQTGTYNYQCDAHVGVGMTGSITVHDTIGGVVISEIMYNPPGADTDLEYLELYNSSDAAINLQGYHFSGITFTFPGFSLAAGEYVIVAADSAFFESTFGITPFEIESGALNNGGELIQLLDATDAVVDEVAYAPDGDWPVEADGLGASLVLCDPLADNGDPSNWSAATTDSGAVVDGFTIFANPGGAGQCLSGPSISFYLTELEVNEDAGTVLIPVVLENGDPEASTSVDVTTLSGFSATQGADFIFSDATITFSAGAVSDTIILDLQIIDDSELESLENILIGLSNPTAEASIDAFGGSLEIFIIDNDANIPDIVLTEIMYNPPESGTDSLEFVEIFNNGDIAVDLSGYTFTQGFDFTFGNFTLDAQAYALIAVDSMAMNAVFGASAFQFAGALGNGGETIELSNPGGSIVFSVTYDDGDDWPTDPDGFGPSLVFCDTSADPNNGASWSPSTTNTGVTINGTLILASPGTADACQPTSEIEYPAYAIGVVNTVDTNGVADSLGVNTELQGIVYGGNLRPGGLQFTLIDAEGDGIGVFSNSEDFAYTVTEGDEVVIRGTIGQFNGLTQIEVDTIEMLSAGNALLEPTDVDSLGEYTESQLIRMGLMQLVDPSQWLESGSFNVDITNGVDTFVMRIDADANIINTVVSADVSFTLTGIGGQFDSSSPYTEGYQILPRYTEDIEIFVKTNDPGLSRFVHLYPNPVTNVLQLELSETFDALRLHDATGRQVMQISRPVNNERLDLSNFVNGLYTITFIKDERVWSTRIVKQ